VHETHLLTLIPVKVNGKPLTLNSLGDMIQTPKRGNVTRYDYYWPAVKEKLGDAGIKSAYWVLMTKDVLAAFREF